MLQKWFRQARCEILYLTWKAICRCLRSAGSGLPFRLWLAGFYQWYLCHQQLLVSRAHLCMRCLAVFASTVLPGNRSVYWQIMWSATLCLLQGERCRLCQCCPWLVLNGSRSVARGQPQIFSRPSLCLGRTAVILTLLLVVVHVVIPYVHQAGMCFAQECVNLSVCAEFLYMCLYWPLFLMLVPAACPAACWPRHSCTCLAR